MTKDTTTEAFTAADMATASAQGFRDGVASVAASAPAPSAHIKEPYTVAEIKAKIASHDYSAELLLQHAMALLDSASLAASAGSEPVAWPKDATEVREFFSSDFISAEYVADDRQPCDEDRYYISAHDFLSAINWWADFPHHPSPPEGMVGGWMPMADAPRDGTLILAAIYIHSSDGTAEWQRHAIYFDEERDCTYFDGCDDTGWEFDDYELWTPLPPPPTTPAGNEKGE